MAHDDSSSESDDEFLTVGNKSNGKVDREALIRKKLLESFYGQTGATGPANAAEASRTSSSRAEGNRHSVHAKGSAADTKDLDSPFFDVDNHTKGHVLGSTVHDLLEMDEQLTLQVRTLDSTTQNMVYENYSKFIDGTAAISSVGVNVQANEQGLERLMTGMATINEKSKSVEDELGSLRDAVAEKIRVKRLLTRLDALLKLPATLREQISVSDRYAKLC
jgi:vacuolar protein sorting-associated protein 51